MKRKASTVTMYVYECTYTYYVCMYIGTRTYVVEAHTHAVSSYSTVFKSDYLCVLPMEPNQL